MTRPVYRGPAVRALYGQLVEDFGGMEACASLLGCSKGTISKQVSGQAAIGPEHFCALEDTLGRWPITDLLADRKARREAQRNDHHALVARVMRENGDLANAMVAFLVTGDEAALIKEGREAFDAIRDLLDGVEGAE